MDEETMQHVTTAQAMAALQAENTEYARIVSERSGDLAIYRPRPTDPQGPHLRDEIYIVASGSGVFMCAGARRPFGPGDAIFVPRGTAHRFEDFTDDFATWVIFLGQAPSRL
jgi:mannose-6-phosphate isomerase-like protein (cupin superfamily)